MAVDAPDKGSTARRSARRWGPSSLVNRYLPISFLFHNNSILSH